MTRKPDSCKVIFALIPKQYNYLFILEEEKRFSCNPENIGKKTIGR